MTDSLKHKLKGMLFAVAAMAALAIGGTAIAGAAGGEDANEGTDKAISGAALVQAKAAALKVTGGGQVTETEVGDEESYYEVEVTRGGSEIDVQLDRDFKVVGQKSEPKGAGDE
ncbi:MAG: hypothetical protein WAO61_00225 [Solirubrobacterales bacterium]